jgi:hypothetical protein
MAPRKGARRPLPLVVALARSRTLLGAACVLLALALWRSVGPGAPRAEAAAGELSRLGTAEGEDALGALAGALDATADEANAAAEVDAAADAAEVEAAETAALALAQSLRAAAGAPPSDEPEPDAAVYDEGEAPLDAALPSVLYTKSLVEEMERRDREGAGSPRAPPASAERAPITSLSVPFEAIAAQISAAAGFPGPALSGAGGRAGLAAVLPKKSLEGERFFTRGKWFEHGRKYFVYQPSGGMSNQRIILEHAMIIAKRLERVLVVPPLAPHTSMFWNYNKVDWDRTVEAFDVFQRERLEAAVPVVGLSNCILRRFVEFNEKRAGQSWMRVEREKGAARGALWTTNDMRSMFGNVSAGVLFFAQTTMWRSFDFSPSELAWAHLHVQLAAPFRHVARRAADFVFPAGQRFIAAHIRFEDANTQVLTDVLSPAATFVRRLERLGASNATRRLFVATMPSQVGSAYFEGFRKAGFELIFSDRLLEFEPLVRFLDRFPKNDIQTSVLGLIEQLVCARALLFAGTGFSTFSHYIRLKRNFRVLTYDAALVDAALYSPALQAQADDAAVLAALRATLLNEPAQESAALRREITLLQRPATCSVELIDSRVC